MDGRWKSAYTFANLRLTPVDGLEWSAVARDLEHLRKLVEQHREVLDLPTGDGVTGVLHRWLSPVVFTDAKEEARYQQWDSLSTVTLQKSAHVAIGILVLCLFANQFMIYHDSTSYVFSFLYVSMIAVWLACARIIWRHSRHGPHTHLIATLNTVLAILIFLSSMLCYGNIRSAQCTYLQASVFNPTHMIGGFAFLVIHSVTLQVPWLIAHMAVIYLVWFAFYLSQFPQVLAHTILVPVCMAALLGLLSAQVYARHVLSRLQFHMVNELSEQLRENRLVVADLDLAHRETVAERVRAVRATTIRDVNESIMGYICHQIRNPLHSLQASLERLLSACHEVGHALTAVDFESLDIMRRSTMQLSKVADDVWTFQELQKGSSSSNLAHDEHVNVAELARHVIQPMASEGHAIELNLDSSVPPRVLVDATRVRKALHIGIENALKFQKAGTPIIVHAAVTQQNLLLLEVQNEGEGLGVMNMQLAFDPYTLPDADSTEGIRCLGLGLPMSKLIASQLGGDVGLEDRGKWTVFWFTVPLARDLRNTTSMSSADGSVSADVVEVVVQPAPYVPVIADLRADKPWSYWGRTRPWGAAPHLRTLVVDDLKSNRLLLTTMLQRQGHSVRELEDGDQILEALHECRTDIDLCLLDIHMVRSDGRDTVRFLREHGFDFVIVAVTGNVSASDVASYYDAGFDGVLGKPFTATHVAAVIAAANGQEES